jgi:hypothetical protein
MEQVEGEFGIPCSSVGASNRRDAREISGSKNDVSILVFPGSGLKKFFDERKMGYSLIWLEMKVVPYYATQCMSDRTTSREIGYILVSEASCSIPLCRFSSAKSNVSLL